MARLAEMPKVGKQSRKPAEKLLEIFERDMSKYSPAERARKWDALEDYVKRAASGARAKR